eukprot:5897688-Pleurochrysis_carterae.AAC.1
MAAPAGPRYAGATKPARAVHARARVARMTTKPLAASTNNRRWRDQGSNASRKRQKSKADIQYSSAQGKYCTDA